MPRWRATHFTDGDCLNCAFSSSDLLGSRPAASLAASASCAPCVGAVCVCLASEFACCGVALALCFSPELCCAPAMTAASNVADTIPANNLIAFMTAPLRGLPRPASELSGSPQPPALRHPAAASFWPRLLQLPE